MFTSKHSTLIFNFFNFSENYTNNLIKKIKISNTEILINLLIERLYKIDFTDSVDCDYKVYSCIFIFESTSIEFGISIYFNRLNYFYCDCIIKNDPKSIEIIFSDFLNKNIGNCYILYNNVSFCDKENFDDIKTRKRISFINIDINLLYLPKKKNKNKEKDALDFNNKGINFKNILISISKSNNNYNIIGIFKNDPYSNFNINKKLIIENLKNIIEPSQNYLNYDIKKSFQQYFENIDFKDSTYKNGLINSVIFNNNDDIEKYFAKYINIFDEDDLTIYKLYSEYLILFPTIKNKNKDSKNLQTYFYIKQYYYSKKAIENFIKSIPNYIDKYDKIKLQYTASRVIYSLLNNGKGFSSQDLFTFIDYSNNKTIYHDAVIHNRKFVNLLKEESEIFPFLLQLNSGSSSNYLDPNNLILSSRISMLSLNQIKNHLFNSILNYGIRIKVFCDFNAISFTETRITAFSEINIFGFFLTNDLYSINDIDFNKRYVLSNIMKHEDFGHIKFSINDSSFKFDFPFYMNISNYECNSPVETYYPLNDDFIEIYDPNSNYYKGESGYCFSYYLTRGNKILYNFLENTQTNFKELFERVDLMISEDLSEFCNKLEELVKINGEEEDQNYNENYKKGKLCIKKKYNEKYIYNSVPRSEKI